MCERLQMIDRCRRQACHWLLMAFLPMACRGLPSGGQRDLSYAMTPTKRASLIGEISSHASGRPGFSGMHPLVDGRDALAARLALTNAAARCLDIQYYIWKKDMAGKVLTAHLLQAADRGVRVRILLDDVGTMPSDKVLLALDSHKNVEVRMFNPVKLRSPRLIGMVADFRRINRRMHNKSFIADGQIAILGGRNIGDEYFGAHSGANFADLDLAIIGQGVHEASTAFDLYWNHKASIPIHSLAREKTAASNVEDGRTLLSAYQADTARSPYAQTVLNSDFARQFRSDSVPWYWGRASIVSDHPDKVLDSTVGTDTYLAPTFGKMVDGTKRELFLVSPYFVPGSEGVERLAALRRRGVRVVVVTNSLASTDGLAVHAGYQRYREPLLRAGVEIYELKPTAEPLRKRSGSRISGSSGASLHAKTFTFDRRIGFVGSYNLDPRSHKLNTEMGVIFDCPELAALIPVTLQKNMDRNAYRLELEGSRLVWIARGDGKETRLYSEPGASIWQRFKVRTLSLLPIEHLL
ncbi:MAG: phospholipase D family protein [Pseudomonas sp.]|nr:MAG: phospholipase D family protein [Pseudomonas sp.]